jgi:hypothetical protein
MTIRRPLLALFVLWASAAPACAQRGPGPTTWLSKFMK